MGIPPMMLPNFPIPSPSSQAGGPILLTPPPRMGLPPSSSQQPLLMTPPTTDASMPSNNSDGSPNQWNEDERVSIHVYAMYMHVHVYACSRTLLLQPFGRYTKEIDFVLYCCYYFSLQFLIKWASLEKCGWSIKQPMVISIILIQRLVKQRGRNPRMSKLSSLLCPLLYYQLQLLLVR